MVVKGNIGDEMQISDQRPWIALEEPRTFSKEEERYFEQDEPNEKYLNEGWWNISKGRRNKYNFSII